MPDVTLLIRSLRDQSNHAIAARDVDRVVMCMDPGITVAVAGGPVLRGVDASRMAFAEQFADRAFLGYVRTPDDVSGSAESQRVMERGSWVGRWKMAQGERIQRGRYTAEWRHSAMGWLLVAETFLGEL